MSKLLQQALDYINRKTIEHVQNNQTPGASISIASKNYIYLSKGYGLSDIYQRTIYTNTTQILLASVSKTLSGTLLCLLEKENPGKILNANANLPTSVPYVSENMLVKDLISHRAGIPEQFGSMSESLGNKRNFIINSLVNVPNRNFRNEHQYTNIPFTQGVVIGTSQVNMSLEQSYRKLFSIIGMPNTSINFAKNKYKGYTKLDNKLDNNDFYPLFNVYVEQQISAGGIYTTAADMAKFIQFQLQQAAMPNEDRLISDDFYNGIVVRDNGMYGVGVNISYQKINDVNYKMFNHSGALINTRTVLTWIPELDIGIFVHVNSSPSGFPEAIAQAFYLKLGGGTNEDADKLFNDVNRSFNRNIKEQLCPLAFNVPGNKQIDPAMVGKYYNKLWGGLIIDSHGFIKFTYLEAVPLYTNSKNIYKFILKDISEIPFEGTLNVSGDKLTVNYSCDTQIFYRIGL